MAARPRDPLKTRIRGMFRSQHNCPACRKNCHTIRGLKAHFLGGHYREIRNTRKGIPRERRKMWVHAWGWREAAGLVDHNGRKTPRGYTRPQLVPESGRGHITHAKLRHAARHDRHHERADAWERRAEACGRRAARSRLTVLSGRRHARAERLRGRAARGRATAGMTRWQRRRGDPGHGAYNMVPRSHPAHPARAPRPDPPARKRAARTAQSRVNGNGTRSRAATPPRGRLAPASRNGRTTP